MNNLTDEELLSVAQRDARTPLELELVRRLNAVLDTADEAQESEKIMQAEYNGAEDLNERLERALSDIKGVCAEHDLDGLASHNPLVEIYDICEGHV